MDTDSNEMCCFALCPVPCHGSRLSELACHKSNIDKMHLLVRDIPCVLRQAKVTPSVTQKGKRKS